MLSALLEITGMLMLEDLGVLALILGRSRAAIKNSVPKSQEGFKGEPKRCEVKAVEFPLHQL